MGLVMHYYEGHKKENQKAAVLLASELKEKHGEVSIEEIAYLCGASDVENLSSEIRSIRGLYHPGMFVSKELPALKFGDLVAVHIRMVEELLGPHGVFGVIAGLADEQPFFDPNIGWQVRPFRMKPIPECMRVSPSNETIDLMKKAIIIGLQEHLSLSEIKYRLVYEGLDKADSVGLDLMEMAFHGALEPALNQFKNATAR